MNIPEVALEQLSKTPPIHKTQIGAITIYYKSDTVDGNKTKRSDLSVEHIDAAPNCKRWIIINRETEQILCIGNELGCSGFMYYEPIIWKTYTAAQKWIEKGCIGELQESFSILNIGFHDGMLRRYYRW